MKAIFYIILSLLAVCVIYHTAWFVDASFLPLFAIGIAGCGCSLLLVMQCVAKGGFTARSLHTKISTMLFLAWWLYFTIHGLFIGQEGYYMLKLNGAILLFIAASNLIQTFRAQTFIHNLLLALSLIESVAVVAQQLNVMESYSSDFRLTGTFDNPNVAAFIIALGVPVMIDRIILRPKRFAKAVDSVILLFFFYAIVILLCRTAILMSVVSVAIMLFRHRVGGQWVTRIRSAKVWGSVGVLMMLLVGGVALYQMKPQSASGRLFIWDTTIKMIGRNPISGIGYGLFEREYNTFQGERLSQDDVSDSARLRARCVFTAYNESQEQCAQGGIVGGLLFATLLFYFLVIAWRQTAVCASLAASICVIAMVNFLVQSPAIWILTIVIWSYIGASEKACDSECSLRCSSVIALLIVTVLWCQILPGSICKIRAHLALKECQTAFNAAPEETLHKLERYKDDAGSSEYYLCLYAKALIKMKRYDDAKAVLQEAASWTANPMLYYNLYKCHRKLGEAGQARQCMDYLKLQNAL